MSGIGEFFTSMTVVFGLLSFCAAGYIMALLDFRPKEVMGEAELHEEPGFLEPETVGRAMSLSELGISQFGDISSLPAEEQRRLKMEEQVRSFSQSRPEDAAEVIRSWLRG